jgi:elongator complex protein 3
MRNEKLLLSILEAAIKEKPETAKELQRIKNRFSGKLESYSASNYELNKFYQELVKKNLLKDNSELKKLIKKRTVRSISGVAIITVLTKPYPCPGKCVFCPNEKGMPKSYLSNEPAAMRALLNDFDPVKQIEKRLTSLKNQGHPTDKIELIVLGGTFSFYPKRYQKNFIRKCFNALNEGKPEKSLNKAQKKNETALHRVVGLSLETRPDFVTKDEVRWLRELGCTKIQLGVQHLDNEILKYVKRGHLKEDSIRAIKLARDAGLKICLHIMPNLPGSTPEKDLNVFKELFESQDFRPDYLKIYPCSVTPFSELEKWFKKGKYKSYPYEELKKLIVKIKGLIPEYVRIERLVRDIPGESILEGSRVTNLRQELQREYPNMKCRCIRCREIKGTEIDTGKLEFKIQEFEASNGKDFFLSYNQTVRSDSGAPYYKPFCESKTQNDKICSLLRLRFPSSDQVMPEIDPSTTSIIREVHTYGMQLEIDNESRGEAQHIGLGKKLILKAEEISLKNGYKKIAVISSIGTREYYKKLGYKLEGTYMMKNLLIKRPI